MTILAILLLAPICLLSFLLSFAAIVGTMSINNRPATRSEQNVAIFIFALVGSLSFWAISALI